MVNLIYETIYQHNKKLDITMHEMAELILNAQERAGMQPPNIKYKEAFPDSTLKDTEDHWLALWEPEDETK